ncbi:hypothetical protein DYL61_18850 [Pseudomonas nabeulensis]|uniref:Uncharacterized protein n=1 Tax=Pseudomonas nabeulensis TaxID=2293833 RepID=A0A4Z0AYX1_9PSED|nr:hypothetical protein DYL61_18850 [Pseudomonas nabeulensis]
MIGFSSPRLISSQVHKNRRSNVLFVLDGGCAQGVFGRAGFELIPRSTNLRTAATLSFSSGAGGGPSKESIL